MRTFARPALLLASFLVWSTPRVGAVGNDAPTGVTGDHSGLITTAGSYSDYTGNGKRMVMDLEILAGASPLRWTRILNTREATGAFGHGWSHSYAWGAWVRFGPRRVGGVGGDPEDFYEGPDARVYYPDGRGMDFHGSSGSYTSWLGDEPGDRLRATTGNQYELRMRDGGVVVFSVSGSASAGEVRTDFLRAERIIDPYGQATTSSRGGRDRRK